MRDSRRIQVGPYDLLEIILSTGFSVEANERFTQAAAFGTLGSGNGNLDTPYGIVTTPDGLEIWIADSSNNRIARFQNDGTWIDSFGSLGSGNGQFSNPRGLVIVGSYVYVTDRLNGRVQKFDTATRTYQTQWSTGAASGPDGIAYDAVSALFYVACYADETVKVYNASGVLQSTWNVGYGPMGVAVSADGTKIVTSGWYGAFKYTAAGVYEGNLGVNMYDAYGIKDVYLDKADHLYVCDDATLRITKQLLDGEHLGVIGSEGTGDLEVTSLGGVIRFEKYLYIVDRGGARVIKAVPTNNGNGCVFKIDADGNLQLTGSLISGL